MKKRVSMHAQANQIVKAYEEVHLSIADIASEFRLSELEIKMCLAQFSRVYRDAVEEEGEKVLDGFREQDNAQALDVIRELMLTSDDNNLRFRAAKFLRQDVTGRLDSMKGIRDLNINVMAFNEQMEKMRLSKERTMKVIEDNKKVIEV